MMPPQQARDTPPLGVGRPLELHPPSSAPVSSSFYHLDAQSSALPPLPQAEGICRPPQSFCSIVRELTDAWGGGVPRQLLHSRGGGSRGSIPSRPAELWIARPLKRTSKQTTPHPKLAGIEECGVKLQHVAILQLSISGLCVAKCRPPRPPPPPPRLPEFCCQLLWRPVRVSHSKYSYPAIVLQATQLQEKDISSICHHQ